MTLLFNWNNNDLHTMHKSAIAGSHLEKMTWKMPSEFIMIFLIIKRHQELMKLVHRFSSHEKSRL